MKIFNKIMILAVAVASILASCDSDPEVGTPLYPVEQENNEPRLYTYSPVPNVCNSQVILTPNGLVIPEDTMEFYVQITLPVEKDVVVNAVEAPELASVYNSNYQGLKEGAIEFVKGTVTIPAGETKSSEPIKAVLTKSDVIKDMGNFGCVAVTFKSDSYKVAKNYSSLYWLLAKKELNVKASYSIPAGMTKIETANFNLTSSAVYNLNSLIDGNTDPTSDGWVGFVGEDLWLQAELNQATQLKAIAMWPCKRSMDFQNPKKVEILTSTDGEVWKSQGEVEFTQASSDTPLVAEFFTPSFNTKFLKINIIISGLNYGGPFIQIVEFELYK